jgi:Flp pilus assembly protein TadD
MAAAASIGAACNARLLLHTLVIAGAGMMLAACSQLSPLSGQLGAGQSAPSQETTAALASDTRSELQKATEYWGKEFAKTPRDAQIALNYARNLKALGEKRQALAVLQQASVFHGAHRGINAEYGRLALEFDQVSLAAKLLEQADDPTNPDWKLISARGTVLAKQGRYRDAIPFYERALALAPDQASILNNLALAHAMEGHPDKAEPLLKRATAAGGHEARPAGQIRRGKARRGARSARRQRRRQRRLRAQHREAPAPGHGEGPTRARPRAEGLRRHQRRGGRGFGMGTAGGRQQACALATCCR